MPLRSEPPLSDTAPLDVLLELEAPRSDDVLSLPCRRELDRELRRALERLGDAPDP